MKHNLWYAFFKVLGSVLCKILFRIRFFGVQNIPSSGGFILASNHTSYLDPVMLGVACPRELNFLVMKELFDVQFLSWIIKRCNTFPINRKRPDVGALKEFFKRLRQGRGVVIFPEGTRSADGTLMKPERGVGLIAIKAGVPVVPVYLEGTHNALPVGAKWIRLYPVSVWFGKPIMTGTLKGAGSFQGASEIIMEGIKSLKN
ncbi:hypothetical protein B9J78_04275 [bacterium Unc6]|nr:hypothetical protein [bacterium Unc6]